MVTLQDIKSKINKLYYAKYGLFVQSKDDNTIIDALKSIVDYVSANMGYKLPSNLKIPSFVSKGDIIDPDIHNNVVSVMKNVRDFLKNLYGDIVDFTDVDTKLAIIRTVKYGDSVLDIDHNQKVDALKALYNVLVGAVDSVMCRHWQYSASRAGWYSYKANRILISMARTNTSAYSHIIKSDMNGRAIFIIKLPLYKESNTLSILRDAKGNFYTIQNWGGTIPTVPMMLVCYNYAGVQQWATQVGYFQSEACIIQMEMDAYDRIAINESDGVALIDLDGNKIAKYVLSPTFGTSETYLRGTQLNRTGLVTSEGGDIYTLFIGDTTWWLIKLKTDEKGNITFEWAISLGEFYMLMPIPSLVFAETKVAITYYNIITIYSGVDYSEYTANAHVVLYNTDGTLYKSFLVDLCFVPPVSEVVPNILVFGGLYDIDYIYDPTTNGWYPIYGVLTIYTYNDLTETLTGVQRVVTGKVIYGGNPSSNFVIHGDSNMITAFIAEGFCVCQYLNATNLGLGVLPDTTVAVSWSQEAGGYDLFYPALPPKFTPIYVATCCSEYICYGGDWPCFYPPYEVQKVFNPSLYGFLVLPTPTPAFKFVFTWYDSVTDVIFTYEYLE